MIDLHSHILPSLDDGPGNMEGALGMARAAAADGVRAVAATPHVIPGLYNPGRERILRAVEEFKARLKEQGIELDVRPGAEYLLDPGLPGLVDAGEAVTLNDGGKYLLVEFPARGTPPFAETVLYELLLRGVIPVIAHPERNRLFIRRPERLRAFIEKGLLVQVTAGSVTGAFGGAPSAAAMQFIRKGWCHILGSDAHDTTRRAPIMSAAERAINRSCGRETASLLVSGNPSLILQGRPVNHPPPAGKNGLWNRLAGWLAHYHDPDMPGPAG
ncbi:MAG: tyrosine-protein phosphatase [Bacillota bacterium]